MDETAIIKYITGTFDDVDVVTSEGNSFFFYAPDGGTDKEHMFPFVTLVTNDAYDQVSDLNRPSVFRLNIGVSKATFHALFGSPSDADSAEHDFTALDKIMPHPVYGRMHWVCVLNPGEDTFEKVRFLLAEAYERDVRKHSKARAADDS